MCKPLVLLLSPPSDQSSVLLTVVGRSRHPRRVVPLFSRRQRDSTFLFGTGSSELFQQNKVLFFLWERLLLTPFGVWGVGKSLLGPGVLRDFKITKDGGSRKQQMTGSYREWKLENHRWHWRYSLLKTLKGTLTPRTLGTYCRCSWVCVTLIFSKKKVEMFLSLEYLPCSYYVPLCFFTIECKD